MSNVLKGLKPTDYLQRHYVCIGVKLKGTVLILTMDSQLVGVFCDENYKLLLQQCFPDR